MNISIKDYFEKNYTEEMQEILFKIISLLQRLNINTYEAFILNKLAESENSDSNFLSLDITNYFEGFLINLSREFGFKLSDATTLDQRVTFIRAYVDLEDYIDNEAVIRLMETDISDSEKLAEAVSLTSDLSIDTAISFIESVDESSLFTLLRIHLLETDKEDTDNEIDKPPAGEAHLNQLKAYSLFLKEQGLNLECLELVRSGYQVGLPFKVYWGVLKDKIFEHDRSTMVKELLGIFFLSNEHWSNPLIAFNNINEELFDSVIVIGEVNTIIRELMSKFIDFKLRNRIK